MDSRNFNIPLRKKLLGEETFAVGPDHEIFAFRGKKLSRIVDFREFAQINFYGIFNNQVREKDRVYFFV